MAPLGTWLLGLLSVLAVQATAPREVTDPHDHRLPVCQNAADSCQAVCDGGQCHCDAVCEQYGDCCYGWRTCTQNAGIVPRPARNTRRHLTCQPSEFGPGGYWLINDCPENSNSILRTKCRSQGSDLFARVPAYAKYSVQETYRNVYCALCNGRAVEDLVLWNFKNEQCRNDSIGGKTVTPASVLELFFDETMMHFHGERPICNLTFEPPSDFETSKQSCVPADHQKCPSNKPWSNECGTLSDPMNDGRTIFKNGYLAPKPVTTLRCGIELSSDSETNLRVLDRGKTADVIKVGSGNSRANCKPSFRHYKGRCLRDPFLPVYRKPELESQDSKIFLKLTLSLDKCISLPIFENDMDSVTTELSKEFQNPFANLLGLNVSDYENFEVSVFETETLPIKGHVVTFLAGKTMRIKTGITADNDQKLVETYLNLAKILGGTNPVLDDSEFELILGVPELPFNCSTGNLHRIEVDRDLMQFFKDNGLETRLTEQILNYDSSQKRLEIVTCDTQEHKFENCETRAYPKTDFQLTQNGTLRRISTNENYTSDQYVTIESRVHVCLKPDIYLLFHRKIVLVLRTVGVAISLLFLIFAVATYFILPKLRDASGVMILNMALMILLAQIFFLLSHIRMPYEACIPFAALGQYCWLSVFVWTNVIAFNTCRSFRRSLMKQRWEPDLLKGLIVGYVAPAIPPIGCLIGVPFAKIYGYDNFSITPLCWFENQWATLVGFHLPVFASTCVNMVCFLMSAKAIRATTKSTESLTHAQDRRIFIVFTRVALFTTYHWLTGFVLVVYDHIVLQYFFAFTSAFVGVAFCWGFALNRRVIAMYKSKYGATTDVAATTRPTDVAARNSVNDNTVEFEFTEASRRRASMLYVLDDFTPTDW